MGHHHSPNDDRSNSKNPNNPAFHATVVNRDSQLNPNNPEFKGNTDKTKKGESEEAQK
jgi:hypothetical protein